MLQRLIQKVLEGLDPEDGSSFITAYIDDILVYSRTLEEHLDHLQKVISRLRAANLKLKPSKCEFVRPKVEYLGHIITASRLRLALASPTQSWSFHDRAMCTKSEDFIMHYLQV